jgi:hypothetical protein
LVRWQGCLESEDTWEAADDPKLGDKVKEYLRRVPEEHDYEDGMLAMVRWDAQSVEWPLAYYVVKVVEVNRTIPARALHSRADRETLKVHWFNAASMDGVWTPLLRRENGRAYTDWIDPRTVVLHDFKLTKGNRLTAAAKRVWAGAVGQGTPLMSERARERESKRTRGREGESARGREGERARGREGERARGREGERARGREGERARGREGERARGREGERARGREGESASRRGRGKREGAELPSPPPPSHLTHMYPLGNGSS